MKHLLLVALMFTVPWVEAGDAVFCRYYWTGPVNSHHSGAVGGDPDFPDIDPLENVTLVALISFERRELGRAPVFAAELLLFPKRKPLPGADTEARNRALERQLTTALLEAIPTEVSLPDDWVGRGTVLYTEAMESDLDNATFTSWLSFSLEENGPVAWSKEGEAITPAQVRNRFGP
ncbi:MAG: hypothetical protein KDL87_18530 [Verrucomicrobiae bacterium]|nr:hypothetical protein [Verrucomicrobiae bacterium]